MMRPGRAGTGRGFILFYLTFDERQLCVASRVANQSLYGTCRM